jgi:hypothetical protein
MVHTLPAQRSPHHTLHAGDNGFVGVGLWLVMVKIIAWNIAQRAEAWRLLLDSDADIALLQEAKEPPADVAAKISVDPAPWRTGASRGWRATIIKLSNRVQVEWLDAKPLTEATGGELGVSRPGTVAAAKITPLSGGSFIAVSVYGHGKIRTA